MWGIFWLAEELLPSQEGMCSMELTSPDFVTSPTPTRFDTRSVREGVHDTTEIVTSWVLYAYSDGHIFDEESCYDTTVRFHIWEFLLPLCFPKAQATHSEHAGCIRNGALPLKTQAYFSVYICIFGLLTVDFYYYALPLLHNRHTLPPSFL
jgi:hypothetical protein